MHSSSFLRFCAALLTATSAYALPSGLLQPNSSSHTVYYGVSSSEHASRTSQLKAAGLRIISLSVSGTAPSEQYSAIWTPSSSTVDFETIASANTTTYEAWVQEWTAKGYVSTQVSASGPASSAVFAGVMEKTSAVTSWAQKCEMKNPYQFDNSTIGMNIFVKGISVYGSAGDRRYCIFGYENEGNEHQTVWYHTDSYPRNYTELYASETQKRFWRASFLDVTEDGFITPIFDDTSVGKWVVRTGLGEKELGVEIATQKLQGLNPVQIQASGAKGSSSYTVIFAELDVPLPRGWNVNGNVTGFQDNAAVAAALDSTMQSFMKKNGMRQAQIAIAYNGTILGERAYTWAESDRATVVPDDKFLLGSVSKTFTHAATTNLINSRIIASWDKIYPLIGITPNDTRANDITIYHLVYHEGGWNRGASPLGDVGFIFDVVGEAKKDGSPATLLDVIKYVSAYPLDFTPGTTSWYSNFGTMLLSYAIPLLTNMTYHDYLVENILNGLEVELYPTAGSVHTNDRIVQESKGTGSDPVHPFSNAKVPAVYGGDGAIKEEVIGSFAMKASASTVAKFLGNHAASGLWGRAAWDTKDGSVAGARAWAASRQNIDWALTLNSRDYTNENAWVELVELSLPKVLAQYENTVLQLQ